MLFFMVVIYELEMVVSFKSHKKICFIKHEAIILLEKQIFVKCTI